MSLSNLVIVAVKLTPKQRTADGSGGPSEYINVANNQ